MFKPFEGIAKITKTVATKSAMNPTLILAGIVVPVSLLVGARLDGWPQEFLFYLSSGVVGVALLQIIGFSLLAPKHLHDNRHVEEMTRIDHASRLGDAFHEQIISADAKPVNNPAIGRPSGV